MESVIASFVLGIFILFSAVVLAAAIRTQTEVMREAAEGQKSIAGRILEASRSLDRFTTQFLSVAELQSAAVQQMGERLRSFSNEVARLAEAEEFKADEAKLAYIAELVEGLLKKTGYYIACEYNALSQGSAEQRNAALEAALIYIELSSLSMAGVELPGTVPPSPETLFGFADEWGQKGGLLPYSPGEGEDLETSCTILAANVHTRQLALATPPPKKEG